MREIDKRLSELEAISERLNSDHERGVWCIVEQLDGSRKLSAQRLGTHHFSNESDMQDFIKEHHKGMAPDRIDFIRYSLARAGGKPPKEL